MDKLEDHLADLLERDGAATLVLVATWVYCALSGRNHETTERRVPERLGSAVPDGASR
ncbi:MULTISPECIES: hypothetical protein [unclassified Burkholderia]|uniref:hypothetical protein n=1 Tax=unclassified Burkholderia TaxID=2613784 RepID=UPI0015C60586|nr:MULTISPECIES: hypothetical protein [unclassified Burkholderia]